MNKRLFYLVAAITALVVGYVAYAVVAGPAYWVGSVEARSSTMPDNPHILYLAPAGAARGLVNDASMKARGATPVRNWPAARFAVLTRPLDALLVDALMLKNLSAPDRDWFRAQFRDGVTLVALGLDDGEFARILSLQTLLAPAEGVVPRRTTEYRLITALLLATPEDRKLYEQDNWIDRMIRGESDSPPGVKYPTRISFRKSEGRLDSQAELELLFFRIRSSVEGAYQDRAAFQQQIKNFGGK